MIDRVAASPLRSMALVGCVSLLIALGLTWGGRMPQPRVHDEFSYLLAADTFAHGRLTNPPHPLWQHFESFHIIQQPTYSSKYPVGQGLSMAVGQVLTGRPIVGVWLTIALACMAITWMLGAFVPPRWALAGGLIAAIHPQVMRWEHNYWGGGVAMLGGALLVGAARRFIERPSASSAAIMTAACVVLANSRPFEGLIVTLLVGGTVVASMWRARRRLTRGTVRRVTVAAAMVALPAVAWMGYFNWRVTGHPLEMPYTTHEATYAVIGPFGWQSARPAPVYRHEVMRRYWVHLRTPAVKEGQPQATSEPKPEPAREPKSDAPVAPQSDAPIAPKSDAPVVPKSDAPKSDAPVARPAEQSALFRSLRDYVNPMHRDKKVLVRSLALNPGLILAFVGLPFVVARDRWGRWAAAVLALSTGGILLGSWMFPHYAAPLVGLAFLVVIMSTRELAARSWGRLVAAAVMVMSVIALAVEYRTSTRHDLASDNEWYRQRAKIMASLRASGEPALIVVRYSPSHITGEEWVYNDADIDRSPVVWAREMDASSNERLFQYFADRRIFLFEPDAPEPTLVPIERTDLRGSACVLPGGSDWLGAGPIPLSPPTTS